MSQFSRYHHQSNKKNTGNADSLFTNYAVVCRICLLHCRSDINVYSAHTQISVASDIIPFLNFRVFSTHPSKRTKRPCCKFPVSDLYPPPFFTYQHSNFKTSLAVNCTLTDWGTPTRMFKSIPPKTYTPGYRNARLICRPCLNYFLWATSEINFSQLILSAEATSVSAAAAGRNTRLFTSAPLPLRSTSEGIHNDVFINLLSPFIGSSSRHHCGVYELIKGKFWGINLSQEVGIRNRTLKEPSIACLLGVLCTVFLIIKLCAETVYVLNTEQWKWLCWNITLE
jgi:hypothetical protein